MPPSQVNVGASPRLAAGRAVTVQIRLRSGVPESHPESTNCSGRYARQAYDVPSELRHLAVRKVHTRNQRRCGGLARVFSGDFQRKPSSASSMICAVTGSIISAVTT